MSPVLFYVPNQTESAIEHVYYIVGTPSYEGNIQTAKETENTGWTSSSSSSLPLTTRTSIGNGYLTVTTDKCYVPDAPTTPPTDTTFLDEYYVKMDCTAGCIIQDGTWGDWSRSDIHVITDWSEFATETIYTSTSGIEYTGMVMNEYDSYDDTTTVTERLDRYYYDNDDPAGKYIRFKVDAEAWDVGGTRYTRSTVEIHSMYNYRKWTDGANGSWDQCHDETVGDDVYTSRHDFTAAKAYSTATRWVIVRSWFYFETPDSYNTATRTYTSTQFRPYGYWQYESDGHGRIACIQQGTQSNTTLQKSDFAAFTGGLIAPTIDWYNVLDGNSRPVNIFEMNSTGSTYVKTQLDAGGGIKLCLRDYDGDYLDIDPGTLTSSAYIGTHYSADTTHPENIPKLKLTYTKIPEWTQHVDDSDWVPEGFNTWDNINEWWEPSSCVFQLITTGTWANDYRPCAFRVTYTGGEEARLTLYDLDGEILFHDDNYQSGELKTIEWLTIGTNGDISKIYLDTHTPCESVFLTNIEFLEP